jgi:ribosomal protein S21
VLPRVGTRQRLQVHGRLTTSGGVPLRAAGDTPRAGDRAVETFEELLLRFRRGMERHGILRDYRRRLRFIPNHEQRRARLQAARRRRLRGVVAAGR